MLRLSTIRSCGPRPLHLHFWNAFPAQAFVSAANASAPDPLAAKNFQIVQNQPQRMAHRSFSSTPKAGKPNPKGKVGSHSSSRDSSGSKFQFGGRESRLQSERENAPSQSADTANSAKASLERLKINLAAAGSKATVTSKLRGRRGAPQGGAADVGNSSTTGSSDKANDSQLLDSISNALQKLAQKRSEKQAKDTSSPSRPGMSDKQAFVSAPNTEQQAFAKMKEHFAKIRKERERIQKLDNSETRAGAPGQRVSSSRRVLSLFTKRTKKARTGAFGAVKDRATKQRKPLQRRARPQVGRVVELGEEVTPKKLAQSLGVKLHKLQRTLREVGERIGDEDLLDLDVAQIVAEMHHATVKRLDPADRFPTPLPTLEEAEALDLPQRVPVITVMGHVDHGKTTLLDYLRHENVAAREAGGITQAVAAFSVCLDDEQAQSVSKKAGKQTAKKKKKQASSSDDKKFLTFIDTPGHQLFSAMRKNGTSMTDVIVLVVAAEDGVMPQTEECIELAIESGLPVIVAVNKIDLVNDVASAVSKIENQVISLGLNPEATIPISARSGEGIGSLKEVLALQAEMLELRAPVDALGEAVVLESTLAKGLGAVVDTIVRFGTIRVNDFVVCGQQSGRIKALITPLGERIKEAKPGIPVRIVGLPAVGQPGDYVLVVESEDRAQQVVNGRKRRDELRKLTEIDRVLSEKEKQYRERRRYLKKLEQQVAQADYRRRVRERLVAAGQPVPESFKEQQWERNVANVTMADIERQLKELNAIESSPVPVVPIVLRADTNGSLVAIQEALKLFPNDEVQVKVIQSSVGDVTEGDIDLANGASAAVIGFNVKLPKQLENQADRLAVPVLTDRVIYHLLEKVTAHASKFLPTLQVEQVVGVAEVLEVFKVDVSHGEVGQHIAGCRVINGSITRGAVSARVIRDGKVVFDGSQLSSLRHLKKDVNEVKKGGECGIGLGDFSEFAKGDKIELYSVQQQPRKLEVRF